MAVFGAVHSLKDMDEQFNHARNICEPAVSLYQLQCAADEDATQTVSKLPMCLGTDVSGRCPIDRSHTYCYQYER